MPHVRLSGLLLVGALVLGAAVPAADKAGPPKKDAPVAYRLSGPYTHDNLTLFLLHGEETVKGKSFLTLDEALAQKKAVVHETKNVNQLEIENFSTTDEVFIQAGDIVKGGQQDRTIAIDLIVPAKSGRVPLQSFCVESGRWSARGKEDALRFNGSMNQLHCNALKLAARKAASQQEVWENVAKAQGQLGEKVMAPVQARASATSLQLTLEHKKVIEAIDAYAKKLQDAPKGKDDVIGYAVCINGKVNNADVYANNALFLKLWPKLLTASATEAVGELKKDKKFDPATQEAVQNFLSDAEKGKRDEKKINDRLQQVEREAKNSFLFETCDKDQKAAPVRRSYIAR